MAKNTYIGVNNVSRKVKKMYIGVNGVARKVKKGYIGVNGVARQFYSSRLGYTAFYGLGPTITGSAAGTIGDYAIFYDASTSTGFTAVSNSLTTTTVPTLSGYSKYSGRNGYKDTNQIHNNQLISLIKNSNSNNQVFIRGINASLTNQVFTSNPVNLSTAYNANSIVEFNNNLFMLSGYNDEDDGQTNCAVRFDSSMTQQSFSPPLTVNTHPFSGRQVHAYLDTLIGAATSPSYLHMIFDNFFLDIYSINTSYTAYINSYRTSQDNPNGFSSVSLCASFDGYALFGLGGTRVISGSHSTYNMDMVSINDSLTETYHSGYSTFPSYGYPPSSKFNVVFDNVLWIGAARQKYDDSYLKYIYKLKSGLVSEVDTTYGDTFNNAGGGTKNIQMVRAAPTSVNDPSFLVCQISQQYNGSKPAMIYQR